MTGANVYYYHTDHLGSSSVITDAGGNKVEEIYYYPFGQARYDTGSVGLKYKYTGQEQDESGLYDYGARFYDPVAGRFISADTMVPDSSNPQALNRYSYVLDNPIIYIDPTGHFTWKHPFRHPFSGIGKIFNTRTLIEIAITAAAFYAAGEIIAAGNVLDGCEVVQTITPLEQAGIHAVAGAFAGGIDGAISGGNAGRGALIGGISGGFGDYARGFIPHGFGYQLGGQSLVGGVTGGIASEISGNGFEKGFVSGAETGAAGYLFNDYHEKLLGFFGHAADIFNDVKDTSGNGSYYMGTAFGATGAVFGSSIGPIGTVIGGAAGGALGSWIGGHFDSPGAGQLNYREPVPSSQSWSCPRNRK